MVLIMRLHDDTAPVVPRRYRCPSTGSGLSAPAPAQRAGAQRLCALAQIGPAGQVLRCPLWMAPALQVLN